jgi:PAS domain-containing protein
MTSASLHFTQPQSNLRERAKTLLQAHGSGLSVAKDASVALRVLFDLAASPETAHDALALLHELQVHQVELDLQNEELQTSRSELEATCERQQLLHDASACAQLVLDDKGCVLECNALALQHLNASSTFCVGKSLIHWVAKADVQRTQTWLDLALQNKPAASLGLVLRVPARDGRHVVAAVRVNPLAAGMLLAWVDAPPPSV